MSETPDQKVEDVLSSVRRLVSSEMPRKPRTEVPSGPGALVLTKDHMVPTDRSPQAATRSLEERIAELEEAVGGQDTEFEPDGSEDQAQHRPDRIVISRPPVVEGQPTRVKSRRLSKISMVETGPANGEAAPESDSAASSDGPDLAEFRRESQIVSKPALKGPGAPSDKVHKPAQSRDYVDTDAEAPMAEEVPTVARASAEVTAFSDPDDVVRTFEARIEAGRPISDPSPLHQPDPDTGAKTTKEGTAGVEGGAQLKGLDEAPEDFDTALSNAVAASLSGLDQARGESVEHQDYLDANEFDGTSDPEITAAQILSGMDTSSPETPSQESQPLVLNDPKTEQLETSTDEADTADRDDAANASGEVSNSLETEPAESVEPLADDTKGEDRVQKDAEAESLDTSSDQVAAVLADMPDDEAMRLLIARMIRAELQGDLGEQITRNVRKLVRREIKRALSAEDLT